MPPFPRYAIYYVPAQGSFLDQFGAEMLGYDAWIGTALPFPGGVVEQVPDWRELAEMLGYDAWIGTALPFPGGVVEQVPDWRELTQDPRKYGFHATLKAPMALNGKKESELHGACADFARQPRRIPLITPVVSSISGFIAVIPEGRSDELEQFAADCVRAFDPFRAPLTPDDRARRNPSRLTPRQVEYLDRWGYPYVMEEFRFHMTLTGRLDETRREAVLAMLRERFAQLELAELAIDRIALFKQVDAKARFEIIGGWQLRAA